MTGIGPASSVWKTETLPLSYIRNTVIVSRFGLIFPFPIKDGLETIAGPTFDLPASVRGEARSLEPFTVLK